MNKAVAIFSAALLAATLSIALQDAPAQPNSQAAARRPAPSLRLCRHCRSQRPLDRAVSRGRQGAAASALRELSSAGDSPHQTDQRRPHQPLVVRGADGHGARRLRATPATDRPTSIRRMCPAIRNGTARRSRWHGKAARSGRSASRSKTGAQRRSRHGGAAASPWRGYARRLAWTRDQGARPAPGTQARFGEIMRAWADAGAACPAS